MSTPDPERIKDLIDQALDLPEAQRAPFLDRACAGDHRLRDEAASLLAALDRADGVVLDAPTANTLPHEHPSNPSIQLTPATHPSEQPGSLIGPYKLLQQIGEGGMGVVFMAEQHHPVRRRVALKIIKPGMDTRQVIARFDAERQALAMMDHPNIAKVLEAGATDTGRPYFVMELVKGTPVTTFCDENKLTTRQRLELFLPVCSALQHAHQKGIIHRDLKPSNVLVTMHDDKPVPKVIDFGVAKAIDQQLTEHTLFTEFRQLIGTPAYMSPEQAQMSGLDTDTRSDIYSLGVLLYELLTGTTPFDAKQLRAAAHDEMRRIIREVDPPKASTRLSTLAAAQQTALADQRRCDPATLSKTLAGDLDWILMRCLEKDRARRYESASALARDLQRHLNDEPVEASPPSLTYKFRKLARKHKREAAAVSAVITALTLGVIGTSIGLARAQLNLAATRSAELRAQNEKNLATANEAKAVAAQQRESSQRKQAEAVAGILDSLFHRLDPYGEPTASPDLKSQLIEDLKKLADSPDKDTTGDPLVRARLKDSLGWTLYQLGECTKAEPLLQSAANDWNGADGPNDAQKYRILFHFAIAHQATGHILDAVKLLSDVQTWQAANLDPYNRDALVTSYRLALAYSSSGRNTDAVKLLERVRDRQTVKFGPDDPDTLNTLDVIAQLYRNAGRPVEAITILEAVYDRMVKSLHSDHPDTLHARGELAHAYALAGRSTEAIDILKEVRDQQAMRLGQDHRAVLQTRLKLAIAYMHANRTAESIPLLEQLRGTTSRGPDAYGNFAVDVANQLSVAYNSVGQISQSIAMFEDLRERAARDLGHDNPATLQAQRLLANTHCNAGHFAEAVTMCEAILSRQAKTLRDDDLIGTLRTLGTSYSALGRYSEAIKLLGQARDESMRAFGPDHPITLGTMHSLARAYVEAGRGKEAIALLEQRLEIIARNGNKPKLVDEVNELAIAYTHTGRQNDAIRILEHARDDEIPSIESADFSSIIVLENLAVAYDNVGRYNDAVHLLEKLRERAIQFFGPTMDRTLGITINLIDAYGDSNQRDDQLRLADETLAHLIPLCAPDQPATIALIIKIAAAYAENGRISDAVRLEEANRLNAVRSLGPEDKWRILATRQLIWLYRRTDRIAEASNLRRELLPYELNDATQKLKENPTDPSLLLDRGWMYKFLSKPEEASADFRNAIELASDQIVQKDTPAEKAKGFANRAALFFRLGKFQEALDDFRKAVELDPGNHLYWHDGVLPLLLQTGDVEGYRRWRIEEMNRFKVPSEPVVAHRVSKDAFMLPLEGEDLKSAVALAEKGLDEAGKWRVGRQTKGMAQYRSGQFKEAIPYLSSAFRGSPTEANETATVLFLAMAYERCGNHSEARAALDMAVGVMNAFPNPGEGDLDEAGQSDWIVCQVVRREAERLINGSGLATQPASTTRPVADDRTLPKR